MLAVAQRYLARVTVATRNNYESDIRRILTGKRETVVSSAMINESSNTWTWTCAWLRAARSARIGPNVSEFSDAGPALLGVERVFSPKGKWKNR